MARFNPNDYATVEERLTEFWGAHPNGRIATYIERLEPPLVVMCASVYRDIADTAPAATGYAHEKEGEGMVNKTSYLENCETSAIGRALANLGLHGRKDAPRPSREEMEKTVRMEQRLADIALQVNELLGQISDSDRERLDAKTKTTLTRIAAEHAAGNAEFLERSLDWLKGVVKLVHAGEQLEVEDA